MQRRPETNAVERLAAHPALRELLAALSETTNHTLYLVGGALRDSLLERPVLDFDFVTQDDARILAGTLAEKLPARYVLLDEKWGVARLVWRRGGRKEPITLDFCNMQGRTIQEDLSQRDFTCNAMALPLSPGSEETALTLLDPCGGLEDLTSHTIRVPAPSAFHADPIRMLRAFRLAASLGFKIDPKTLEAVRDERRALSRSASERIGDEVFKFLACTRSHSYLLEMDRCGLLTVLAPELEGLKGLQQGPFHHFDGWNHSLEAYRRMEHIVEEGLEPLAEWKQPVEAWIGEDKRRVPLLKFAALLHDVGKPGARSVDGEGTPHFYGHAKLGADTASSILKRLRTPRSDQEQLRIWVRYHMAPLHLLNAAERGHLTERAKIRLLRRLGENGLGVLILAFCDRQATRGTGMGEDRLRSFRQLLTELFHLYVRKDAASLRARPLLNGNELQAELGLAPGPMIGRLLRLLEEARIEGRILDRTSALDLARSLLRKMEP